MLMKLQVNSQTTSTTENRVKTFINENGDTLVQMCYKDARTLLNDVLEYQYTDSLLGAYKDRDSLNTKTITLQKETIVKLSLKQSNYDTIINNLSEINKNKDNEINLQIDIIKQQKKEIRKQKFYKTLSAIGSIVLPIITLFCGFLIIRNKNNINFKKNNFMIFAMTTFLIIFSEISMRYIATSKFLTVLYILMPIIIFIISYYTFYKLAKNV